MTPDLNYRLCDIKAGSYQPVPGTVGDELDALFTAKGCGSVVDFAADHFEDGRDMSWPLMLEAMHDSLSDAELLRVSVAVRYWVKSFARFNEALADLGVE